MKTVSGKRDIADIKRNNIINILDMIRQPGTHSRREIQKSTGLSWGAVSSITASLLKQGLVIETGEENTAFGRKPSAIDVNPHDNYLIGVDLNISGMTVVVSDIKGGIKSEVSRLLLRLDREYILAELFSMLDEITGAFMGRRFLTIGIAAQGLVDTNAGISVFSSHFLKWEQVNICELLAERYSMPAYIFHDPDCVLLTERFFSNSNTQNMILIRLDRGIGMSAVVNGEVFFGSRGHSAELGHITMEVNGPRCGCGKNGCLEVFATSTGIVQRFLEQVNRGLDTSVNLDDPGAVTYLTIYKAAKAGDALSMDIYQSVGFYIGMAIANVINLLGPDEIILYGHIAELHDIYENEMFKVVEANVFYARHLPSIRFSRLSRNAAALGGGLSAFSRHIRKSAQFFSEKNGGQNYPPEYQETT